MESSHCLQLAVMLLWSLIFMHMISMADSELLAMNQTRMDGQNQNGVQRCRRFMNYAEIIDLLEHYPCVLTDTENSNGNDSRRHKRWPGGSETRVNALNGVVNEHRTIINYLMNTSVNATFLKDSIMDHHENTGPSFRSWRDLTDLICLTLLLFGLIYILVFRCGFTPCNNCLMILSKHCVPSNHQKKIFEQQLQENIRKHMETYMQRPQQQEKTKTHSIRRKKPTFPSTPSVISGIAMQTNTGYVTD